MLSGLHDTKQNQLFEEDFESNNLILRTNDAFRVPCYNTKSIICRRF
jgi:hypothetical protein